MSGEHAKREMVTDEKLEGLEGRTMNGFRQRRLTITIRRNPLPPSSHIGRVTRRKIK
jgi:hypothetical protein